MTDKWKYKSVSLKNSTYSMLNDLTKTLVSAAQKFNDTEYNRLQHLIFALLHGVNFGYTSMDQRFLDDSSDIYFLHKDKELSKQLIKTKKKYKKL